MGGRKVEDLWGYLWIICGKMSTFGAKKEY
jgi:hypothetical protein